MSPRVRLAVFAVAAAVFAGVFVRATRQLHPFGTQISQYGDEVNRTALPLHHASDAVTAVVFDYRGFDTLGEEFILFASITGVALLLRPLRKDEVRLEAEAAVEPGGRYTPLLRLAPRLFVPVALTVGLEIISHGHLTPGGGFQGGVVIGAAFSVIFLFGGYRAFEKFAKPAPNESVEGGGVALYVLVGVCGVIAGLPFLTNVFPLGKEKAFLSSGTIWALNLGVGLAVGAAFTLLPATFLEQLTRIRHRFRAGGRKPQESA